MAPPSGAAGVQLHITCHQQVAVHRQLGDFAGRRLQGGERLRRKRGQNDAHRLASALADQREMHVREHAHVVGQLLVDREPHQYPAHQHRRFHGNHHELVGESVNQRDLAALRVARQRCRHALQGRSQGLLVLALTHRLDRQAGIEQCCHGGADAFTVVLQGGSDRGYVSTADCRAESKIGGQHGSTLNQLLRVLVQQTAPDALAHLQFLRHLAESALLNTDAHHAEYRRLHQQQQQQ